MKYHNGSAEFLNEEVEVRAPNESPSYMPEPLQAIRRRSQCLLDKVNSEALPFAEISGAHVNYGIDYYSGFLVFIWRISSEEYQMEYWIGNKSPYVTHTFHETLTMALEDMEMLTSRYEDGMVLISRKQYKMIKKLEKMVNMYNPPRVYGGSEDDHLIVHDPKWTKVRLFAKKVLESLLEG